MVADRDDDVVRLWDWVGSGWVIRLKGAGEIRRGWEEAKGQEGDGRGL